MIKSFCDNCEKEIITDEFHIIDKKYTCRSTGVSVNIRLRISDEAIPQHFCLCKGCAIDAINTMDERPQNGTRK